jgi:hypothetical protein
MMDAPTMPSKEEFVGGMVRRSNVEATSPVPVEILHHGGVHEKKLPRGVCASLVASCLLNLDIYCQSMNYVRSLVIEVVISSNALRLKRMFLHLPKR